MPDQQTIAARIEAANSAQSYQKYFVPVIGAPMAEDLVALARLRTGERVLDVACGTGVVTRLAAQRVGAAGSTTGLDSHPGMLEVAATATPSQLSVDWRQSGAESMPFPDGAFDAVLCQMGLQFFTGKLAALREMRRVLATDGRALVSVPGPKPALFGILTDGLARHIGPAAAAFADLVFSLHDVDELARLVRSAGFRSVDAIASSKSLRLPASVETFCVSTSEARRLPRSSPGPARADSRHWSATSASDGGTSRTAAR